MIISAASARLVKNAYVDFERDETQRNPVVAYLQRHGLAMSIPISPTRATTEYNLTSDLNLSPYHALHPELYSTPCITGIHR